jgi:hypothetical protein
LDVWNERETPVGLEADDREIATVGGKNGTDVFPRGEMAQCGVGEFSPSRFTSFHQFGEGRYLIGVARQEGERDLFEPFM